MVAGQPSLTRRSPGVFNLRLDLAAHDPVHEYLLVISHAKLRGATGAWVAPLAIV